MGLAGGWHCVAVAQAPGLPVLAQDLHETRRPLPFPDVLKLKSANGPSCRPASGTFHRSVPVMPAAHFASHAFDQITDFDTPSAPGHTRPTEAFCG